MRAASKVCHTWYTFPERTVDPQKDQEAKFLTADYRHMYYILCNAASRALDAMPEGAEDSAAAAEILKKALEEAEELYIETTED